jgi:hypothetical protein
MKVLIEKGRMGFRWARLGSIAALSLCLATGFAIAAETVDMQPPPANVLPWISEVVKMNNAGVPQDVMASYVRNNSARSTLSADDIIYLRNQNVPNTLITTMIEHGAVATQTTAPASVPMPTTAAPVPTYAGTPMYAQYGQAPQSSADYAYGTDQSQPVVNYNYYGSSGYGNGYPYYYGNYYPYYYYYPVWYFPNRFCFRPGFNNGFHVHSNGAVHFNSGFSHSSAMGSMGGHGGGGMHR